MPFDKIMHKHKLCFYVCILKIDAKQLKMRKNARDTNTTKLHKQKNNKCIYTRRELFEPLVTTEIPILTFDENTSQIIQANVQENVYRVPSTVV